MPDADLRRAERRDGRPDEDDEEEDEQDRHADLALARTPDHAQRAAHLRAPAGLHGDRCDRHRQALRARGLRASTTASANRFMAMKPTPITSPSACTAGRSWPP